MKTGLDMYASGKVILSGEHAVVYGARAVAIAIPKAVKASVVASDDHKTIRLRVKAWGVDISLGKDTGAFVDVLSLIVERLGVGDYAFTIEVEPFISYAMGLGGSAAIVVATIRAINCAFDLGKSDSDINDLAYECEKISHGVASGIDNSVATYGGALSFCRDGDGVHIQKLEKNHDLPLLIVSTGKKGYTSKTVERVAQARMLSQNKYDMLFDEIDKISQAVQDCLVGGDFIELGALMDRNQVLLREMGVSCVEIDEIVSISKAHNALGAKLTGGGDGGVVIVLCEKETKASLSMALMNKGYEVKEMIL